MSASTKLSSVSNRARITAIVVNYRTPDLAKRCINALFAQQHEQFDLRAVLVDGYSNDESSSQLSEFCDRHSSGAINFLPLQINGGFGWANNQVILNELYGADPPDFIYLLNPDAVVTPQALPRLVDILAAHPEAGAAGSMLIDEAGQPLGGGHQFPSVASEFARGSKTAFLARCLGVESVTFSHTSRECDWVTGASVLFRTAALAQCGPFDDGFFLYFEDTELMWRLRRNGWSIWHEPASVVEHVGGAATGIGTHHKGRKIPARPRYWYQARQRYLSLTLGPALGFLATAAWLAGVGLWKIRQALGLAREHREVENEVTDTLRLCRQEGRNLRRHVPRSIAEVGMAPAWMSKRDG